MEINEVIERRIVELTEARKVLVKSGCDSGNVNEELKSLKSKFTDKQGNWTI